jgi:hypothetical protein
MRKKLALLTSFCFLLILFSCHKSNSKSNSQGLTGNWTFLYMNAQTQTTTNVGGGITAVAISNYTTKSNGGTIAFTADSMVVTGLTYAVDTTFTTYFYFGNTLYDSASAPLSATLPATSASAKYQVISSDSLYFPNGGILSTLDPSATQGEGGRYTISGDSLSLSTQGIDTAGGANTLVKSIIHLKRQ